MILDSDLARLYGVETKALNRAVKRNAERFPKDFMFQLTRAEFDNLKYQIGTSSSKVTARDLKQNWSQIATLNISQIVICSPKKQNRRAFYGLKPFILFGSGPSGGSISARIASNTLLNCESYFRSSASTLRARSL